jgi:[ribosomal protein S5]-alanine N-acetyltransferase
MLGPVLRGERVVLEPARLEDAPLRLQWLAELQVTRHLAGPGARSLQMDEEWFDQAARDQMRYQWRIVVAGDYIGEANLHDIDGMHRHARSGMWIGDTSRWGKGYGSEVVRLRTAFALGEMGLERIETCSIAENVGMHRALERSGFRRIGVRTHAWWYGGAWHDEFIFEVLHDEWLALQESHP